MNKSARKRLWERYCDTRGCPERASHEVIDRYDILVGKYCEKHADDRVDGLNLYERAIDTAFSANPGALK